MVPDMTMTFLPISLAKASVTSPCFLFCFQSEFGMILKCLKTSTKGCCQMDLTMVVDVLDSVFRLDPFFIT